MSARFDAEDSKVLIVEGKTDKDRLLQVLAEPVEIVCTQGSLSYEKMEELVRFAQEDVYILVDADEPGNKLRAQLKQELPNATHLYTRKTFREVAATPLTYLAKILDDAHFDIHPEWLAEEAPTRRPEKYSGGFAGEARSERDGSMDSTLGGYDGERRKSRRKIRREDVY